MTGSLSGSDPRLRADSDHPVRNQAHPFHSNDIKGSAGKAALRRVVHEVEAGIYRPNVDRVLGLDDIVAAHRYMENDEATGKVVVVP